MLRPTARSMAVDGALITVASAEVDPALFFAKKDTSSLDDQVLPLRLGIDGFFDVRVVPAAAITTSWRSAGPLVVSVPTGELRVSSGDGADMVVSVAPGAYQLCAVALETEQGGIRVEVHVGKAVLPAPPIVLEVERDGTSYEPAPSKARADALQAAAEARREVLQACLPPGSAPRGRVQLRLYVDEEGKGGVTRVREHDAPKEVAACLDDVVAGFPTVGPGPVQGIGLVVRWGPE